MAGKARCKAVLQHQLGLAERPDAPLFILVSRLTEQKGLHLVLGGLDALLAQGGQLALLGSGEAWLEEAFRQRAARGATIGQRHHRLQRDARAPVVRRAATSTPGALAVRALRPHADVRASSTAACRWCARGRPGRHGGRLHAGGHGERRGHRVRVRRLRCGGRRPRVAPGLRALRPRALDWRRVRGACDARRPADWGTAAAQYIDGLSARRWRSLTRPVLQQPTSTPRSTHP